MKLFAIILIATIQAYAADSSRVYQKFPTGGTSINTTVGTAFAISDTIMITAYHNLTTDHAKGPIKITMELGEEIEILAHEGDIAILKCKNRLRPLKLAESDVKVPASLLGEEVKVQDMVITEFTLSGKYDIGGSGAPVLKDGKVIGMVLATSEERDKAYCVGVSKILELLKKTKKTKEIRKNE